MFFYDILASLASAVLSGMGVGSGGLLVIYFSLFTDLPQRAAQGINLLFFLFSGGTALAFHGGKRHLYPGVIFLMSICGIAGSFLGVFLSHRLPPTLLRKLFGGMLVITGLITLQKSTGKANKTALPAGKE